MTGKMPTEQGFFYGRHALASSGEAFAASVGLRQEWYPVFVAEMDEGLRVVDIADDYSGIVIEPLENFDWRGPVPIPET